MKRCRQCEAQGFGILERWWWHATPLAFAMAVFGAIVVANIAFKITVGS